VAAATACRLAPITEVNVLDPYLYQS